MLRAARRLVDAHGIRQFIDIGSGSPYLHEVAQEAEPTARVVYVDNDPLVGAHSRALLTSTAEGRVEFLLADATKPDAILASSALSRPLDPRSFQDRLGGLVGSDTTGPRQGRVERRVGAVTGR